MAHSVDPMPILESILTEYGPLHEDDIERRLRDAGVTDPEAVSQALRLERGYPARQLPDESWVWLPSLLAGRVFTHRLGADEAAHDLLAVSPDLDPVTELCEHEPFTHLADGSPVYIVVAGFDYELLEERGIAEELLAEGGALLLAPGTLAALGATAGDLVGVRLGPAGLTLEVVEEPGPGHAVGDRLARMLDTDEPEFFAAVAWKLCVEDAAVFTAALPPLSEIADDAGLPHDGDWLAPRGFDFAIWRFERRCALLAERHGLEPDEAFALHTLTQVHGRISALLAADALDGIATNPEVAPLITVATGLATALADPLLAELLVAETVDVDPTGAPALGLLAETMEPKAPRAARVAVRWLRAVAHERVGDIVGAERELLAAESMDPDWPLPLLDLARIASDRGDAERGLALLRRAGEPDHPLVDLLERHRAQPRKDVGRNEPCWCGSGRKYKKCHLGHEELPLAERVNWLYAKGFQHVIASGWTGLLMEVSHERGRYSADDDDDDDEALADPLVLDAVLFEGGAFEEFVSVRGSLLPDDERSLAEQWLLVQRSVFEVEQVRRGEGLTLRDIRTGDIHEVRERTASRQLQAGQLICARVVPAGDGMVMYGLEPVDLRERDALIELLDVEPDAVTLVAQLTRRFAPPKLVNTEGDPMVLCTATVQGRDLTEDALDGVYDRVDGEPQWMEYVTTDGLQRIRAALIFEGDTLKIETNSEARMDRVLATLSRLDATMTVLDDERQTIGDAREAAALAAQMPITGSGGLDPDSPEMAAVLESFIRDYETRWLDESIPALDGYTPRQAADDPTRRGDLIRLLDSFPAGAAAGGGMDADRLRAALGLG